MSACTALGSGSFAEEGEVMGQPSAARGRPLPCGTPPSYRSIGKDAARAGKSFRALFALLFCLVVPPTPLRGQTTGGTLSGTVSDPTGAVVPGADVLAKNLGTNVDYRTQTTSAGLYVFPDLPAGSYSVTFEAAGF